MCPNGSLLLQIRDREDDEISHWNPSCELKGLRVKEVDIYHSYYEVTHRDVVFNDYILVKNLIFMDIYKINSKDNCL